MKKVFWLLPGVLSILYGFTVAAARSGSRFYLVWIAGGIFWFFAVWMVRRGYWERLWRHLPGTLRTLAAVGAAAFLLLFLLVEGIVLSRFGAKGPADLDYIIVLGAQVHPSGPSLVLRYRLDTAAAYLRANPRTVCIVSGGRGSNETDTEAAGMYAYLTAQGIDGERILLEDASENTIQNIQNSFALLDPASDRIGIVTSNFHVCRGMAIARKQGGARVYGISAPSHPLYLFNNLVREFVGVGKDFLFGNL